MLLVTTGAAGDQGSGDAVLARAVHDVLATLSRVRGTTDTPELLQDRIALVRWLRLELSEVETLLVREHGRSSGG